MLGNKEAVSPGLALATAPGWEITWGPDDSVGSTSSKACTDSGLLLSEPIHFLLCKPV